MSEARIGISGWTYAPWRGTFYPPKWPQKRELEFASRAVRCAAPGVERRRVSSGCPPLTGALLVDRAPPNQRRGPALRSGPPWNAKRERESDRLAVQVVPAEVGGVGLFDF